MHVIPAIDLRAGRCVRLVRGDFDRETVYGDDPVTVARHWMNLGAPLIHVVDLDGARNGSPSQLDLVRKIARLGARIELGGGLRRLEDLRAAIQSGVSRVIIGTAAVENDLILRQAVREFGADSVVLGLDARDGRVAVDGWVTVKDVAAADLVRRAQDAGVERVIYTDIERDGTLTAPNFGAVESVAAQGIQVIASGGVSSAADLNRLSTIPGVEGAIVGKALYEGAISIGSPADWWVSTSGSRRNVEENDGSQE
ncbi:MAG: 1-(5-phosphoribosyl)-5-[(5-phosphoribosylamino)methylideneamino]imidazole-4-carboxamide isomerase [Nitrolancea sp.]